MRVTTAKANTCWEMISFMHSSQLTSEPADLRYQYQGFYGVI